MSREIIPEYFDQRTVNTMAKGVNKVILLGRLGGEPESRQAGSTTVSNFTVATSEKFKNQQGEWQERTEWHRVVIFNEGLVGVVQKYLKKGAQVYIEGQLNTNKYTDSNGQEKYSTQIVLQGYSSSLTMLDGKRKEYLYDDSIKL